MVALYMLFLRKRSFKDTCSFSICISMCKFVPFINFQLFCVTLHHSWGLTIDPDGRGMRVSFEQFKIYILKINFKAFLVQ